MADLFGIVYGSLLVLGGAVGFLRTSSIISLAMGLILGGWSIFNSTRPSRVKRLQNIGIASLLCFVMLYRFFVTGKWFPALLVVVLSTLQVFLNALQIKNEPQRNRKH